MSHLLLARRSLQQALARRTQQAVLPWRQMHLYSPGMGMGTGMGRAKAWA
jgi:hypothetical protein